MAAAAPTVSASVLHEFVPFGRSVVAVHPLSAAVDTDQEVRRR